MALETTYPAVLGTVLSRERQKKGWDQATTAEKCGINRSSWSRMEKGEILPDALQLKKITRAFGISTDDFFAEVERAEKALNDKGLQVHQEKKPNKAGWFLMGAALGGALALALSDSKKGNNNKPKV